ncbi:MULTISPECIES: adenosine deaminase [Clostridium]|jgi:adenosine deaminase|uniref:Adenosine deaminase n=1 Tax=Clostridium tertium TaxID=1559 RepID=A0A9X4B272_9CLOT|nr:MULTISPECIES: adenosine deaminase [Clostridium]MBS5883624.1 adenosine deaminase [Clostridium sp.]MBU6135525.1 adenosine deaminase [Clostridium tertium]MDB1942284.1 adenosine deaminase [Clostridium tertium]MDC4240321.1 adenosine deaminase [Clostridium tertium]MDI9215673.1 adenosine deaminase [Clostridium tertium]
MDINNLPKIELHCHLDGSLRVETVIELAKKENIQLDSYDYDYVKNLLTVEEDCDSLDEYLKRFDLPNEVLQTKENLRRASYELLEDAVKDNVKYIEVRFAPIFHTKKGLALEEIIESVIDGIRDAENKYDIKGNVIISCIRGLDLEHVYESINASEKYLGKGVVAIDLAASEREDFAYEYIEAMKIAKEKGFRITIHAGETGFGKNVRDAINLLGAERIGHGVYIFNDVEAYKLVKENGITLEMCPKSNLDTKAVNSYEEHPIYKYHKDNIKVNLSTDNRTVSNINLNQETNKLVETFKVDIDEYKKIYINSVNAAFCDDETKAMLLAI